MIWGSRYDNELLHFYLIASLDNYPQIGLTKQRQQSQASNIP